MKFEQLCSYLRHLYAPENLAKLGVDNPLQFAHQPAVIARAWQSLVERKKSGVILADEVGLGKTFEALGVMYFYLLHLLSQEKRDDFKVLIVLPPNLVNKWQNEIERFAEQIQGTESVLNPKDRYVVRSILDHLSNPREISVQSRTASLVADDLPLRANARGIFLVRSTTLSDLMGYSKKGAPLSVTKKFSSLNWDIVLVDEAHAYARLENGHGSNRGQSVYAISRQVGNGKMVLCTATPFQLNTSEMANLVNLIEHDEKKVNDIENAIENYNEQIISLRNVQVDTQSPNEMDQVRKKLMEQKLRLETLLRPYLLRSQRPDKNQRQQIDHSIEPGDDFSWLYWNVREWARQLSTSVSVSGEKRIQTFLPITLQISLSSANALHEHLNKFHKKHGRIKRSEQARQTLMNKISALDFVHPKHHDLNMFIKNQIEQAASNFDGKLEKLAAYKCVIFVSHKPTIKKLTEKKGDISALSEKLQKSVQERTVQLLDREKIRVDEFRKEIRASVKVTIEKIQQEFSFAVPEKPDIWETLYEPQVGNEYWHLRNINFGRAKDLSGVVVSKGSIRQFLISNLNSKLLESLSEYELLSTVISLRGKVNKSWKTILAKVVEEKVAQRVHKPLSTIHSLYYGNNFHPDQPREKLRLRLSLLAYSFSPRKPIEALYGDVDFATRQQVIDSFNNDLYPLMLVCSSVAEEGIDLQKRCNTVVHYDLEWNPAKVEQREGRVDRLGRASKDQVRVLTFKLAKTYDERILARCKNRKIWMELYLCKTWQEEGKKTEEETIQSDYVPITDTKDLMRYRLDLSPESIR